MKVIFLSALALFMLGCSPPEKRPELTREEAIQEIYDVEQAFNDMLAKEGRAVAFAHFAADNGGIQRSGKMIVGKSAIKAFYAKSTSTDVSLTWKPDRIDISNDLSMASTWGKFQFSGTRENGEHFENTGIFHTVWKKQEDGSWKYIYD